MQGSGQLARLRALPLAEPGHWARDPKVLALVALTALGASLRFSRLGQQSFWIDEILTVDVLRSDGIEPLRRIASTEGNPPLYFLLAKLWIQPFGLSEVGLRSLSALAGTATIPVAYLVTAKLASRRSGLVVAALTAVSPLLVWYSQEARSYALLVLFCALSLLFLLYALESPTHRRLGLWSVVSALALWTHYFAILLLIPEAIWLLRSTRDRRAAAWATGGIVAAGVALLPLVAYQQSRETGDWIKSLDFGWRLAEVPKNYLVGPSPPAEWLALLAAVPVLVGLWVLLTRGDARERHAALIMAVIGVTGIVAVMLLYVVGVDYFLTRYLLPFWLPLAIVVAIGLGARRAGTAGGIAVAALCAISLAMDVSVATQPRLQRDDWRGAVRALGVPTGPRAIVASPEYGLRGLANYTSDRRIPEMRQSGARVTEIALLGLSPPERGEALPPPRPSSPRLRLLGFRRVAHLEAETFTLIRYRSPRPRWVRPAVLANYALDEKRRVGLQTP
jgi:mannosyltransferase